MVTLLFAIALSDGCHRPTLDQAELAALAADATTLKAMPATMHVEGPVAERDWPAAIRRLDPERVVVRGESVELLVSSYFDGGWGYYITSHTAAYCCSSAVGPNIYWHEPC